MNEQWSRFSPVSLTQWNVLLTKSKRMYMLFGSDCLNRKFSLTKAGSGHLATGPSVLVGHSFTNNADVYSQS